MERITAITTVHHALNPAGSDSFGDNGDEDEYPDDIEDTGLFWGTKNNPMHKTGMEGGPCYWTYEPCKYRFWINWGCGAAQTDFSTPVPC